MKYEIRVLIRSEDTLVIESRSLIEVDQMIEILGVKFGEVVALTVSAIPDNFSTGKAFVLHQQRFLEEN